MEKNWDFGYAEAVKALLVTASVCIAERQKRNTGGVLFAHRGFSFAV